MRCLLNCFICLCKYLTDKLLYMLNLLVILPCVVCLIVKSNTTRALADVGWSTLIIPIALVLTFDVMYCLFCKCIQRERQAQADAYSSVV